MLAQEAAAGAEAQELRTEALVLAQMKTNFQQLLIAMTASAQALADVGDDIAALHAQAAQLTHAGAPVPKQEILPVFHRLGQLFEVCSSMWSPQGGTKLGEGSASVQRALRAGTAGRAADERRE